MFEHSQIIPILRSFSEEKACEFYLDFLGFSVEWRHRFEDGAPLYMQVRREGLVLHLSEHYGDASPGAQVRVMMHGVAALHAELTGKGYARCRPEMHTPPWGGREMAVTDPFHNRITFVEIEA